MRVLSLVAVGMLGCAHPPVRVGVRVPELMHHLDELGRDGRSDLETVVILRDGKVRPGDRETVFADQTVTMEGQKASLTELVTGCPPFAASTPCRLSAKTADVIILRTLEGHDPTPSGVPSSDQPSDDSPSTVMGVLSLASFGGMTICLVVCGDNKTVGSITLGGAGVVLGLLWALTSGHGHD